MRICFPPCLSLIIVYLIARYGIKTKTTFFLDFLMSVNWGIGRLKNDNTDKVFQKQEFVVKINQH